MAKGQILPRVGWVLAAVVAVSGCSRFADIMDDEECVSTADCTGSSVCFYGRCVAPGASTARVYAELTPPSDSPWLVQQAREVIDLARNPQEIRLQGSVELRGTVPGGGPGKLWAFGQGSMGEFSRTAVVSGTGFALTVIPGWYTLRFVPDAQSAETHARPPVELGRYELTTNRTNEELAYPDPAELIYVWGRVRYAPGGVGVSGAMVQGTASDDSGGQLLSSKATTDEDGCYALVFPPGAHDFSITVRPGANPSVPEATLSGLELVDETTGELAEIILGVDPVQEIIGNVQDGNANPVAGAMVVFRSEDVGTVAGLFLATDITDAGGAFQATVLPGTYQVLVAPPLEQSLALTRATVSVPTAEALVVALASKVLVRGRILSAEGAGVAEAAVTLSLRNEAVSRQFAGSTDVTGAYQLWVDPGSNDSPVRYEMVVEPDPPAGLPRHWALLDVGPEGLSQDVHLHRPAFVYGRVFDPSRAPAADVVIAFFSFEQGTAEAPVLIGMGQTSLDGEFVVTVPTPDG